MVYFFVLNKYNANLDSFFGIKKPAGETSIFNKYKYIGQPIGMNLFLLNLKFLKN